MSRLPIPLAGLIAAAAPALAQSQRLSPADVRGIRDPGGGPFLLTFLAIKTGTEDRTVMEFDASSFGNFTPWAYLELGMSNIDPGGPDGIVDIFTYEGDGVVTPGEFYAGAYDSSFIYNDGPGLARPDITRALQALQSGFLGVRLSTTTTDRFWLGSIIGQPEPVLVVGTRYADCDRSTGEGVLDIFDFLCFQNAYVARLDYACCCDTTPGCSICDIFDFLCFHNFCARGCR